MIAALLAGIAIGTVAGIVLVFLAANRVERDDARRIQRFLEADSYDELPWTDPQLEHLLEDVHRGETSVPEK